MVRHVGCALLFALLAADNVAGIGPMVITGATGKTGSALWRFFKSYDAPVRALVRNATKARAVLGCTACDEAEGIYIGDVTKPETLGAVMEGASGLAILTSSAPICDASHQCHFPEGGSPKEVDWLGAKAQIEAFAVATKGTYVRMVVLCSSMGTTEHFNSSFMNDVLFHKLNGEAFLMSTGLPWSIVKPCGLSSSEGRKVELVVGHDDELDTKGRVVAREDVARVMAAATQFVAESSGNRFDLCSGAGPATGDEGLEPLLHKARYPWQSVSSVPPSIVV